jgi:hypothetical protein
MSEFDWILSSGAPLCVLSDSFYYTARDTVFRQLTKDTTPQQWEAALEYITQLRDDLVQSLYPMHYGSLVGGHRCVDHLFREARARLHGLQVMQPVPPVPAPPPPAPPPKPRTLRDVVKDFGRDSDGDKPEGQ